MLIITPTRTYTHIHAHTQSQLLVHKTRMETYRQSKTRTLSADFESEAKQQSEDDAKRAADNKHI
jgi:hypothetical protein